MKKFILLSLLLQLGWASSYAQENEFSLKKEEICNQWSDHYFKKQSKKNLGTFKQTFKVLGIYGRILFLKNSVISTSVFGGDEPLSEDDFLGKKEIKNEVMIYTSGLSDEMSSDPEKFKEQSKIFKNEKDLFTTIQKKIDQTLKSVKTREECKRELGEIDFTEISRLESYFKENAPLQNEINNNEIFKISEKASKKYSNENVKRAIIETLGDDLKSQMQSVAILTLHASEDGRLFDANYNQIPISVFKNLSHNIQTLILYSCHPEAVAEKYKLKDLVKNKKINLILPVLHKSFISMLQENIPAQFLELFLKKAIKQSFISKDKESSPLKKNCKLEINTHDALVNGKLGVSMNQNFIGFIDRSRSGIFFDCTFLKEKNVVVIQNMNLQTAPTFTEDKPQWTMSLNDGEKAGELTHFYSDQEYNKDKCEDKKCDFNTFHKYISSKGSLN